jgi:hypothetical protein
MTIKRGFSTCPAQSGHVLFGVSLNFSRGALAAPLVLPQADFLLLLFPLATAKTLELLSSGYSLAPGREYSAHTIRFPA